jgi:hypothetical protein
MSLKSLPEPYVWGILSSNCCLYPEWTEKPSSGESVRKLPRDLLIQIDSREQHPLLFPDTVLRYTSPKSRTLHRIKTETVTLKEGDYRLASHPTAGVCERKAGLSELTQNTLSGDRPRFTRAINRLLGCCSHPFLLIECAPVDLLKKPPHTRTLKPGDCADTVASLLLMARLPTIWQPCNTPAQRRKAGELVVRFLMQAALHEDQP